MTASKYVRHDLVVGPVMRLIAGVACMAGWLADARAEGVVVESHAVTRPDDTTRLLAPLHEELAARGFLTGDPLARRYQAQVSRPALSAEGLPTDFEDRVERGHRAWVGARFDEAIATLDPVIATAYANPRAFAHNQTLRDRLRKAQIALALSHQRTGDIAAAKALLGEVLRSFPDTQVLRSQYGPDAFALFEDVRRAHGQGGRGRLRIMVPTDASVVFINERFEGVGDIDKGDVIPGEYRVHCQDGKRVSRVHRVVVRADDTTEVSIDLRFEATLHASASWTGFLFASAAERGRLEARYAVTLARQLGANRVIVIGIDRAAKRSTLSGALVDLGTARELRRASLVLDPEPSADRVRSLARFLAGDEPAVGLEVQVQDDAKPRPDDRPLARAHSRGSDRSWMRWAGIGGVGLGLIGGGLAIKSVRDGRAAADELERVCAVMCSSTQARELADRQDRSNRNALISGSLGGAALVAGVVLLVVSRGDRDAPAVAAAPIDGGTIATFTVAF